MPLNEIIEEIKSHPKRFLLGLALGSIPIAGLFAAGYASRALRETHAKGKPTLPAWGDWKQLAIEGLKLGLLVAAFNIPLLILMVLGEALGALVGDVFLAAAIVIMLGVGLAFTILFFSAWKRLACTHSLKQALKPGALWGEARQKWFWLKCLKLLVLAVALLVIGNLVWLYGIAYTVAGFVFLFMAAFNLGLDNQAAAAPREPKPGGKQGKKMLAATLTVLLLSLAVFSSAHYPPNELPKVFHVQVNARAVTLTAPSWWQYYWLDAGNLKLYYDVFQMDHRHELYQPRASLDLGKTTSGDTDQSKTVVLQFGATARNAAPVIYTHEQCHFMDSYTKACFKVVEESFGTWGEFLLKMAQFIVSQIIKGLTGQFTPAGIAVDAIMQQVTNQLTGFLGLGDYGGIPPATGANEGAGTGIEAAFGENALGQEWRGAKKLVNIREAVENGFKKRVGEGWGKFGAGFTISALSDLLVQIIFDILRAILEAMGLKETWNLAEGCANIKTTDTVPLQPSNSDWPYTGEVRVTKAASYLTEVPCPQAITITPPPTGGEPNPPKRPPKNIDTIPKVPKGGDVIGEPPIIEGPPLPPPEPPLPPDPPPRPECTKDDDCRKLNKLYCDGVIAKRDRGKCLGGRCEMVTEAKSCDDNNPATEDKCEVETTPSLVTIQCRHKPLCGNGQKDSGENCSSCPADVKCDSGQYCEAGVCKNNPCKDKGGDTDQDGVCNADDNCPNVPNNQSDKDSDGTGDSCDETPINCGGWATELGKESYASGWTSPGTGDAAKSYCAEKMWEGVDKPVCMTTCLKVTINAFIKGNETYVCCARGITRLSCNDCPGQNPTCPDCGEGYASGGGAGGQ